MYKHSFWKWWSRGENRGDSECLHLFFISFPLAAGVEGCQFLTKELSPHPWQWKCRVLTTGPPRNSDFFFCNVKHQENREELRYRQNVGTQQRKRSYFSFLRLEGKEKRWWESREWSGLLCCLPIRDPERSHGPREGLLAGMMLMDSDRPSASQ